MAKQEDCIDKRVYTKEKRKFITLYNHRSAFFCMIDKSFSSIKLSIYKSILTQAQIKLKLFENKTTFEKVILG